MCLDGIMTPDETIAELQKGNKVHYRYCPICHEPMVFSTLQRHPVLVSCMCRPEGFTNVIHYSWDDLRLLLEKMK